MLGVILIPITSSFHYNIGALYHFNIFMLIRYPPGAFSRSYNLFYKMYIWFCCVLLCYRYAIRSMWSIHSSVRLFSSCLWLLHWHEIMVTSSNGNNFRVTGPLWGESTGYRWIPLTKGQWRGALMFSLICDWTNGWANNRGAGDLRRHRANHDVTVMSPGCQ